MGKVGIFTFEQKVGKDWTTTERFNAIRLELAKLFQILGGLLCYPLFFIRGSLVQALLRGSPGMCRINEAMIAFLPRFHNGRNRDRGLFAQKLDIRYLEGRKPPTSIFQYQL